MDKKLKEKLTRQFKFEDYILLLVGVVAIITGLLIMMKIINPGGDEDNPFSILLILMGIVAIITGVSGIIKKRKYRDSVFYSLLNDLNSGVIKEKLLKQGLNYDEIEIESDNDSIYISVQTLTGEFSLSCFKNNLVFSFSNDEEDDVIESIDSLKLSLDEVYLKFVCLSKEYKNK